jgi:glucosamine--fructose-6-phosphate aminotransferase (isomerizing)
MCGIVAYIGPKDCVPILMEGLARVEYRGYDSAGLAVLGPKGGVSVAKKKGKLRELEATLPKRMPGRVGIGHTRWATHGEPSDHNAHPHLDATGNVAVVHNGIVENAAELRAKLEAEGVVFHSETDTEVLAHLIARERGDGGPAAPELEDAVRAVLRGIEGTYGLCVVDARQPDRIVIARNGSPVIIGVGEKEMLVGSDVAAMIRHTKQVVHLDDHEMAVVTADGFRTFALDATPTQKRLLDVNWSIEDLDKGGYEHFMRKEILEQPDALERALRGRVDDRFHTTVLGGVQLSAREILDIRRIKILGCGSAYIAGLAGAHILETLTRIPSDSEPASEFRYRNPVIERDVLYVAVSQSGETADTLAAVQEIKRKGGRVIAVVNVVGSTIAREADGIYMHAGPEVSVASTKVFTSMIFSFALLAVHLGRVRDLGPADGQRLLAGLRRLPDLMRQVLAQEAHIKALATKYRDYPSMFFVGRNTGFPIAMEGALKLKEISYVHAEAYASSELKHGPLALVCEDFPVVAIVPDDSLFEKNISTVQQVRARRGPCIGVVQAGGMEAHRRAEEHGEPLFDDLIVLPSAEVELDPMLFTLPLQLFAYHLAIALDRDVDQPRNLAKSVTVE